MAHECADEFTYESLSEQTSKSALDLMELI